MFGTQTKLPFLFGVIAFLITGSLFFKKFFHDHPNHEQIKKKYQIVNQLQEKSNQLTSDIQNLNLQIEDYDSRKIRLKAELDKRLSQTKKYYLTLEFKETALSVGTETINNLQEQLDKINDEINYQTQQNNLMLPGGSEIIIPQSQPISAQEEENKQQAIDDLRELISTTNKQIIDLITAIEKLTTEKTNISKNIEPELKKISNLESKIQTTKKEKKSSPKRSSELETLSRDVNIKISKINSLDAQIIENQQELSQSQQTLAAFNSYIADLIEDINNTKSISLAQKEENLRIVNPSNKTQDNIKKLQDAAQKLTEEIKNMKNDLEILQQSHNRQNDNLNVVTEQQKLTNWINQLNEEINFRNQDKNLKEQLKHNADEKINYLMLEIEENQNIFYKYLFS